jgi:hypothetical protein
MLVAEVLQNLGYTAIEATDGASGLGIVQSNARIELLVTDVGVRFRIRVKGGHKGIIR